MVNANYWSGLSVDIEYNPLFHDYLQFTMKTCAKNPLPTELHMHPENMPYYRVPRLQATAAITDASNKLHIQTFLTNIVVHPNFWRHTSVTHASRIRASICDVS
jgi:hypothetical protein